MIKSILSFSNKLPKHIPQQNNFRFSRLNQPNPIQIDTKLIPEQQENIYTLTFQIPQQKQRIPPQKEHPKIIEKKQKILFENPKRTQKKLSRFSKLRNQKKQILCMDLLNFSFKFLQTTNNPDHWDFPMTDKKVKFFVSKISKNFDLICFIDYQQSSKETQEKWITRRENDLIQGQRQLPVLWGDILSEMFQKYGAKVYYCTQDCDQTIANWAYLNKASILSRDQDYFRYTTKNGSYNFFQKSSKKPYNVYRQYTYDRETHQFLLETYNNDYQVLNASESTIEIKTPLGRNKVLEKLTLQDETIPVETYGRIYIQDLKGLEQNKKKKYFGNGSPLIKSYGNPYYTLKTLRSALYYKLGITKPVEEVILDWEPITQQPIWISHMNTPQKNIHILNNPFEYVQQFLSQIPENCEPNLKQYLMKHNTNIHIIALKYHCLAFNKNLLDFDYIKNIQI